MQSIACAVYGFSERECKRSIVDGIANCVSALGVDEPRELDPADEQKFVPHVTYVRPTAQSDRLHRRSCREVDIGFTLMS